MKNTAVVIRKQRYTTKLMSERNCLELSTSYIQRRLQIGYNRAASLMERMELEGIVGQANHAGKREILVPEEEGGF